MGPRHVFLGDLWGAAWEGRRRRRQRGGYPRAFGCHQYDLPGHEHLLRDGADRHRAVREKQPPTRHGRFRTAKRTDRLRARAFRAQHAADGIKFDEVQAVVAALKLAAINFGETAGALDCHVIHIKGNSHIFSCYDVGRNGNVCIARPTASCLSAARSAAEPL